MEKFGTPTYGYAFVYYCDPEKKREPLEEGSKVGCGLFSFYKSHDDEWFRSCPGCGAPSNVGSCFNCIPGELARFDIIREEVSDGVRRTANDGRP